MTIGINMFHGVSGLAVLPVRTANLLATISRLCSGCSLCLGAGICIGRDYAGSTIAFDGKVSTVGTFKLAAKTAAHESC